MSATPPDASVAQTRATMSRAGWFGCIATTFVVLAVAAAVWFGVREYQESHHREACRANLKQIGAALQAYHDRYKSYPPAYVLGPTGERYHSWRVLLLPFLGEQKLYDRYRFDEPWNGTHNRSLAEQIRAVFACPSAGWRASGVTNYLAVVGRGTAWPEQHSVQRRAIVDGAANTIQLVESSDSDIVWLEPRDLSVRQSLSHGQVVNSPTPSSTHSHGSGFSALCADGMVRFISHRIDPKIFRSLLSINGGRALAGVEWPPSSLPDPSELPLPRLAADFRSTDVLPVPTEAVTAGRNHVYCATFEVAWADARAALGGGPIMLDGMPPMATMLNAHTFDRRNLSANSFFARGGPGTSRFRNEIREEVANKFPNSGTRLLDEVQGERALLLHAYLLKSLRFETAFDDLPQPLAFRAASGNTLVRSFGIRSLDDSDVRGEQLQAQVRILDYASDDDFALQLTAADSKDVIVLAKMMPAATLDDTVTKVRSRIAKPDSLHTETRILNDESLTIPRLIIGVERRYSEIIGRDIIGSTLYVGEAVQTVRFRLDETGALLESEALVIGDDEPSGAKRSPPGHRKFIFDRPFLIYLIERDADQPYFAAWIETAELMEPMPQ